MENTVISVYDNYAEANAVVNELLSAGFSRDSVYLRPDTGRTTEQHGSSIGNFFRSLFGMEEHHEERGIYAEAVRRGNQVVSVDAPSADMRDRAIEIMNRHNPIDIEERAAHWRSQGWTGYDESAPALSDAEIERERQFYAQGRDTRLTEKDKTSTISNEEMTRLPVIEEELQVGKRMVQRGGVRIFQRVRERPVHEQVELREEHMNVERQRVDRPATEADMAAFKDSSVELRESAEESVVAKTAHVVEEVSVSKETTQHTEDIRDTVRRTDVQVEQLGTDDTDFRRHWQSAYGQSSGGRYEDYDAAYRYGSSLGGNERFRNYRWEDVEPDARRDWEARHPESKWEKVKDAVRYGAEKISGRH